MQGNECLIGSTCRQAGDKNSNGCEECKPSQSKTSWSAAAFDCKISGTCYKNGDKHPSSSCSSLLECSGTANPTDWTVTGNGCYISGSCYTSGQSSSSAACSQCVPTTSKTTWTPVPNCPTTVIAALNEAHNGNLGGLTGANLLCANQAATAGKAGTWKALLSTTTQNVKDLITGAATAYPVVNLNGFTMYSSWNTVFTQSIWNSSAGYLITFDGKVVDEPQGSWTFARGWHGSTFSGLLYTNYHCSDWTSTSGSGRAGEWDLRRLLYNYSMSCSSTLAVACVRVAP